MPIQPIYLKTGPNWPNWQCCLSGSSKRAPRILIAMGAVLSSVCSYLIRPNMNFWFLKIFLVQIIADYVYFHMTYDTYIWNHAGRHRSILNMTHFQLFAWLGQTLLVRKMEKNLNFSFWIPLNPKPIFNVRLVLEHVLTLNFQVQLKYGFCKKFCPDQCRPGKNVRTKVFNWSEVHLYPSNFLQNPYFRRKVSKGQKMSTPLGFQVLLN